jgi:1-deoxy-D-xylulose-5-phosphate synthase
VCEVIHSGEEIAVVSVGAMYETAANVCEKLRKLGKNPTLINAVFVKPVTDSLIDAISGHKFVFTIEDNLKTGGFGALLAEKTAQRVTPFAFENSFITHGKREELLTAGGLSADKIFKHILNVINE